MSSARDLLTRMLSIADQPGDDDDTRLRKRVGVAAGYLTIVAPLGVVLGAPTQPLVGWAVALSLSAWSVGNLVVLARTRRFERFVLALIAVGGPFTLFTTVLVGGVTHNGGGLVWAFLVPAYALLALGPRRATPWFFVFLGTLIIAVAIDPFVGGLFTPPPYVTQLFFYVQNIGAPLTVTFLLLRYTDIRRRAAEARSDELLTNAIPSSIAARLRHGESRIAEAYPATTVVFADVVGFTPWANRTEPERVVSLLDDLFTRVDAVAATHGIEKIKTVGDAYMAVAGAPEAREDHARAAIEFGGAVLAEVADWRRANDLDLEVRIGIASGPVVGGVIGRRRILFDLWGGTVNLAARMESSGLPGRIQVAESTRALVDGRYAFEERRIEVKGLGPMTTFLLVEADPLALIRPRHRA
jgi:adenylate cyclase